MRGAWLVATLMPPSRRGLRRLHDYRLHRKTPAPRGATTSEISSADLRQRISIFADDSMQGRRTGTPGNAKGNAYIASEVQRLGLGPRATRGTFLQKVPLSSYAVGLRAGHPADRLGRAGAVEGLPPLPGAVRGPRPPDQRVAAWSISAARPTRASLPSARGAPGEGRGLQQRLVGQQPRRARPESAGAAGAGLRHRGDRGRHAHRHLRAGVPDAAHRGRRRTWPSRPA